jgi:hypothetical protein
VPTRAERRLPGVRAVPSGGGGAPARQDLPGTRQILPGRSSLQPPLTAPPSPAAAGPAPTLAALGPAVLASLDAVLALQASPDATARRRQALRRGDALLDRLEELRVALLEGSLPVATLQELRRALARPGDGCDDPALAAVVGEIELRVAVELAKLERACRAG